MQLSVWRVATAELCSVLDFGQSDRSGRIDQLADRNLMIGQLQHHHSLSQIQITQMLPATHPDSPEEVIPPFDVGSIPDEAEDVILEEERLPPSDGLPRLVLGCATFGYGVYADKDSVRSTMPVRVVRAALRGGMNAFDTG